MQREMLIKEMERQCQQIAAKNHLLNPDESLSIIIGRKIEISEDEWLLILSKQWEPVQRDFLQKLYGSNNMPLLLPEAYATRLGSMNPLLKKWSLPYHLQAPGKSKHYCGRGPVCMQRTVI